MDAKRIIMLLTFIVISANMFSQVSGSFKLNQFNEQGLKDGLWIERSNVVICEIYYDNGVESGVFKQFSTDGRLQIFGEYKDGQRSGTWYFFENDGSLVMVFKDFDKNTFSVTREYDGVKYTPDYKCYFISYHHNGKKESEGILLWPEGDYPETDGSVEYGEWKYYDETGKLTKTVVFK